MKHINLSIAWMFTINIFEFFLYYENLLKFITLKLIICFIIFLICFILFCLKIIGGGDGKTIIILFMIIYSPNLSLLIILLFFFTLTIYFIDYLLVKYFYIRNSKKNMLFNFLFYNEENPSKLRKFYLTTNFTLKNLSDLTQFDLRKYYIKLNPIIFNFNTCKFQVFVHYRPPFIFIISLSFITLLILLGFK